MQLTGACCLSFQRKNRQTDEKKKERKSAALSKSGVSQWLKSSCRPTEQISPENQVVTKHGSTFVLMEGKLKTTIVGGWDSQLDAALRGRREERENKEGENRGRLEGKEEGEHEGGERGGDGRKEERVQINGDVFERVNCVGWFSLDIPA